MADFKLDTKNMAKVAKQSEQLAKTMQELKKDLEGRKNQLLSSWVGKGRNEFEKQYRLLNQQFSDITEDTWDMFEKLVAAEEAYILADTVTEKGNVGVNRKL